MERKEEILAVFRGGKAPVVRDIETKRGSAVLMYKPNLTDAPMCSRIVKWAQAVPSGKMSAEDILTRYIFIGEGRVTEDKSDAVDALLCGDALLFYENLPGYMVLNVRKYDKRSIDEPPLSTVAYGPREGFIEDLKTNLCLVERRIHSPRLAVENLKIGRVTKTDVAVVYLDGVASPELVKRVIKRLESIQADGIMDVQYIQPYLEERPFSVFNQVGRAEKPDIVSAKLLEGRIAVFVNGTPMALTVPYLFMESVQSSADYYQRYLYSSFLRILRMITLGLAILLPGIYVALQKFHLSIIPLRFMMTVITALNGIPFRATTEMLFVILLFEIIRETGIRMPKAVGMAMSIVGALVLGETAVRAGIVSSPAVMIVALSSLALYTAPDEVASTTLLRVIFTIIGGLGGIYLLLIGIVYLAQYMVGINGMGAPYLAPFAPFIKHDMHDAVIRDNFLNLNSLPQSFPTAESK